jgi:hypothetical protein
MSPVRPRFQINASTELINHAKIMALSKNMSLTQYILHLLVEDGDEKMKQLVEKELGSRTRPGNPTKSKD